VARRQADANIRSLQNTNVERAQKRMEGEDIEEELAQARVDHGALVRLKAEGVEVEARWKEAYDVLVLENNRLRGSGSEALLAAQWRQRYESTLREREELETVLGMERERGESSKKEKRKEDAGKYECKYKDLKESFRMYRKKAKEIFEAQQRGEVAVSCFGRLVFYIIRIVACSVSLLITCFLLTDWYNPTNNCNMIGNDRCWI